MPMTAEEIEERIQAIRDDPNLPTPPIPTVPVVGPKTPMRVRLFALQQYLKALEYNYTGTTYFDLKKNRSFKSIVTTARDVIREALPIQCLEAVFVSSYLTAGVDQLDRYPVSFKSKVEGRIFRHIILVVKYQNHWGALGLSRSKKLMFKEMKYQSFSELIREFISSYESCFHEVLKIYIGFPMPHSIHSSSKVEWRVLNTPVEGQDWQTLASQLDLFMKESKDLELFHSRHGKMDPNFESRYFLHVPPKGASKSDEDDAKAEEINQLKINPRSARTLPKTQNRVRSRGVVHRSSSKNIRRKRCLPERDSINEGGNTDHDSLISCSSSDANDSSASSSCGSDSEHIEAGSCATK